MSIAATEQRSSPINQEKFLGFVREILGGRNGREDDDHPLPPGPWDPIVRQALEHASGPGRSPESRRMLLDSILASHPEIYDGIGGGLRLGEEVELNPQPLPPRYALLVSVVQTVVRRVELLQEIADAIPREGVQQGIIIVGGYISRFSDEWCGNGFRLKWPFPGPRPSWFTHELRGIDLVVMAAQFEQAAREAFNPDMSRHLTDASTRFVEAGLSKVH
jgi:hypothetical protein